MKYPIAIEIQAKRQPLIEYIDALHILTLFATIVTLLVVALELADISM